MNDDASDMLDDCESNDDKLNTWEADFVTSLRNQLDDGRDLSERQLDILETIWRRVTR